MFRTSLARWGLAVVLYFMAFGIWYVVEEFCVPKHLKQFIQTPKGQILVMVYEEDPTSLQLVTETKAWRLKVNAGRIKNIEVPRLATTKAGERLLTFVIQADRELRVTTPFEIANGFSTSVPGYVPEMWDRYN